MSIKFERHLTRLIETQKQAGRYRYLESNSGAQGRSINVAGEKLLNFSSNDYLGLCADSRLKEAATTMIQQAGVGAGAAALLSGRHAVHQSLEKKLSDYAGYEAALIFSSGYMANLGLISALVTRHDEVHHDKLNHASLIDAVKLSGAQHKRYRHADVQDLSKKLSRSSAATKWILTDGVFSMDGDLAPLNKIAPIANEHDATLVVDDAHGFGVLGTGKGVCAHYGLTNAEAPIVMVTFGKALGSAGAAVLGSKHLIEYLVQSSRTFIYDTALPPALAATALAAVELLEDDKSLLTNLNKNILHFRSLCREANIDISPSETPIQPLVLGDEARALAAAESLRKHNIYVRAVRPPTVPAGTSRLRICISAAHRFADIETLVDILSRVLSSDPARETPVKFAT